MSLLKFSLLVLCIWEITSLKGVDFSSNVSKANLSCLYKKGYKYAIIRASRSNGKFDQNATKTIPNAFSAGMKVDIYIWPCRGHNVTVQVYNMMNNLSKEIKSMFDTVWIDVELDSDKKNYQKCRYQSYSAQTNCDYVLEAAAAIKAKGKKVGIYGNRYHWSVIFNSSTYCSNLTQYPLWYSRYDGLDNFQNYSPFGGWKTPYMKQTKQNQQICGSTFDLDWRPDPK